MSRALIAVLQKESPYDLDRPQAYLRWRDEKLARYPRSAEALIVEVRDPRALSDSEAAHIRRVCAAANMAVYASPLAGVADKDIPRRLGARLGLERLQANPLADEDGISSLEVTAEKSGRGYVPYSNRRLLWHTDGYYNPPGSRIRAFLLHCVRPAAAGGENRLLDPEIAYILLRDADPRYVRALSAPDAMTVPANEEDPTLQRAAQTGPVFSFEDGALHMRYTARTRSIEWRQDAATQAAVKRLREILDSDSPYVFRLRLSGGQGLVCNNVLHDRSEFTDAPGASRLVYRARYADRIGPA
ncbi:MAG: TauD/TfdA family dioxygenase [Betaproteobacteria bacterium]|nr:TauD/TfdA family dioxygenase [Betaproteobacteria bacterium]